MKRLFVCLAAVVTLAPVASASAQSLYPLYPLYPGIGTLSNNRFATPAPVIPYIPPTRSHELPRVVVPTPRTTVTLPRWNGPAIVGRDGTYLGELNGNRFDPDSVSNPYGRYGSRYSPDSINNPYGTYGSRYSPYSPTNRFATEPPLLIGR
jgi:hypothetical protein